MFVERKVRYSALLTNLVGWHAGAVSFPLSDVILAQLACPLSEVMFCLHMGINKPGNTKGGSITVPLTSSLTSFD
jgi:hypothetical protein